ncbi:MAG: L,D-transpeptidase family protein [Candidatus Cybelea sp.]
MNVVYDGPNQHLKVFDLSGNQVFMCEARNTTVAPNAWRYPDAGCPPGTYTLLAPESNDPSKPNDEDTNNWIGEGLWFVPIDGIPGHTGIGIHGGGSCVQPNELDPNQGWCPTENCIRLQNSDLATFVGLVPSGGSSIQVIQSP